MIFFCKATAWMPKPTPIPGCPPGLEYLCRLEEVSLEKNPALTDGTIYFNQNK